jgi:hypothetical protein
MATSGGSRGTRVIYRLTRDTRQGGDDDRATACAWERESKRRPELAGDAEAVRLPSAPTRASPCCRPKAGLRLSSNGDHSSAMSHHYAVIMPRLQRVYEWSAEELGEPSLLKLVRDGNLIYGRTRHTGSLKVPRPVLPRLTAGTSCKQLSRREPTAQFPQDRCGQYRFYSGLLRPKFGPSRSEYVAPRLQACPALPFHLG